MNDAKTKKRIHVVAGVIWDYERKKILISRRASHLHKGGYWEFPGGKVEVNETEEVALFRELNEELNIQFSDCKKIQDINYDYPEKSVKLAFFDVYNIQGNIQGNQGQEWRWVLLEELQHYQFPEANDIIVDQLVKKIQIV
jgi:8-oxo-dGTP diphosphatase